MAMHACPDTRAIFAGILAYSAADVADLSEQQRDLRPSADLIEAVASLALPIGPLEPGAGDILRRAFKPKIFQVDEQKFFSSASESRQPCLENRRRSGLISERAG